MYFQCRVCFKIGDKKTLFNGDTHADMTNDNDSWNNYASDLFSI